MNLTAHTLKMGLRRGWIEFRVLILTSPQSMIWALSMAAIFLGVLWFQRNSEIEGVSLALLTLPSLLGMQIATEGLTGMASYLSTDREDGTLLRAKAVPHAMSAYFISRITVTLLSTILNLLILFVPALFLVEGLTNVGWNGLLTVLGLMLLGLLATAPIGAIIGALVKSSGAGFGLTFLPLAGLVAISGIFYPITALAGWVQAIAQAFPVYWLGLGLRSTFLPDSAAALELGNSWRPTETIVVLGIWSVVGLLVAPVLLKRRARKVNGSEMEAGRQRIMQRGY